MDDISHTGPVREEFHGVDRRLTTQKFGRDFAPDAVERQSPTGKSTEGGKTRGQGKQGTIIRGRQVKTKKKKRKAKEICLSAQYILVRFLFPATCTVSDMVLEEWKFFC